MTAVAGVVLCGGRSTRMGRPKAWLPVGGETLLARTCRVLAEAGCGPVVVVAAPGQDLPPLTEGVEVVRDPAEGDGPLRGLATGLSAVAGRAEVAFVAACDLPHLTPNMVRRIVTLADPDAITLPHAAGFPHPLAAVYPLAVLPVVERLLAAGGRRLLDVPLHYPTRTVNCDDSADALRGVNTPGEYAAAVISVRS